MELSLAILPEKTASLYFWWLLCLKDELFVLIDSLTPTSQILDFRSLKKETCLRESLDKDTVRPRFSRRPRINLECFGPN